MEKEFEKIHVKLDKMSEDLTDVKLVQARIEGSQDLTKIIMDEHIKRTNLAEENILLLRNEMRQELSPVKKHVQLISNIFKFTVAIGSVLVFLAEMGWLKKFAKLFF